MNRKIGVLIIFYFLCISNYIIFGNSNGNNDPLISKIQRDCELESINIGTRLADRYNSLDEDTEWDTRIHHDYLVKYLGFAGWIQMGLWKNTKLTAFRQSAPEIHQVRLL